MSTLKKRAMVYSFLDSKNEPWETHVFFVARYEGQLTETETMCPEWFALGSVPYTNLWADFKHWFPEALNSDRGKVYAEFAYEGGRLVWGVKK